MSKSVRFQPCCIDTSQVSSSCAGVTAVRSFGNGIDSLDTSGEGNMSGTGPGFPKQLTIILRSFYDKSQVAIRRRILETSYDHHMMFLRGKL